MLSNWLLQSVDSCLAVNKHVKFLPSARPQEHGVREHRFACAFVVSVPLTEEFRSMDPVGHPSSGSGHAPCASDCMRSGSPPKNPAPPAWRLYRWEMGQQGEPPTRLPLLVRGKRWS